MTRRRIVLLIVLVLGAAALSIYVLFTLDMRSAYAAIAGRAQVADTAAGPIEYAEAGTGVPLLSIHGAGGGFDQGLDNASAMLGTGFRVIAPSRFGYLGTPVPDDVSPEAQADAHAALLDSLGIGKTVVLGISAGTRSALELALRHPDRVSALILVVPATYVPEALPLDTQRKADYPLVLWLVNAGADFAWWALERLSPDTLVSFIGVPPDLLPQATPKERGSVTAMIRSIEPLSARFAGINIDSAPDLADRPLERLAVPTLLISARDDLFNTLPSAGYAASRIPGARLVVFETGGHLLVGHGDEVRREIAEFLAGTDALVGNEAFASGPVATFEDTRP